MIPILIAILILILCFIYMCFLYFKVNNIESLKIKLDKQKIKAPFGTTVFYLILNSAGTQPNVLSIRKDTAMNSQNTLFLTSVQKHDINAIIIKDNAYKISYKYEDEFFYYFNIDLLCDTSLAQDCDPNNITNIIGTELHVLAFHIK